MKTDRLFKILLTAAIPLLLSACGGASSVGGGGGSGSYPTCATSTSSYCTDEFNNNYGLVRTKAYEAFDDGYDGDGIKVAVLDGGFDTSHSDLDANIITGYDEEDDDNTPNADNHTADMGGHGTHVAGIIAAEKNGTGMMGIAFNASIMPVKIFDDDGNAMADISNSVAYAVDNGAIALNNSWGTTGWTSLAVCTIGDQSYYCYGKIPGTSSSGFNGTAERTEWDDVATGNAVAVFAAGNNGNNSATGQMEFYRSDKSTYLTSFTPQTVKNAGLISYTNRTTYEGRFGLIDSDVEDNWLNVVAVDKNNLIASYSNGCGDTKAYCIAAPGSNIYSTVPTDLNSDGYARKSGTSMAAPHVSGAVAVMKEKWPNLTGAQIIDLILDSATDLGASGTDDVYGVGLLNMAGAMTATTSQSFSYVDSNGNLQRIEKGGSLIKVNSVLGNLASSNTSIGIVDSYNRVYSNRSNQFNSFKVDVLSRDQKFNKYRNGFTNANLLNSNFKINMGFVDYGQNPKKFNLKYRAYPFQEDQYQNTFLGDDVISLGFLSDNTVLASNLLNENNSYLITKNFTSINDKSKNSLTIGYGYEYDTVLNSEFKGAFETKNNTTLYANMIRNQKISDKDNLHFKLGYGITKSNFTNKEFFHLTDIVTSNAAIGYVHSEEVSKFAISLEAPLSVNSGQANYYSVSGYDKDGNYKNSSRTIDLKSNKEELKLSLYYDKVINENANYGIQFSQSNSGRNKIQYIYSKTF